MNVIGHITKMQEDKVSRSIYNVTIITIICYLKVIR